MNKQEWCDMRASIGPTHKESCKIACFGPHELPREYDEERGEWVCAKCGNDTHDTQDCKEERY